MVAHGSKRAGRGLGARPNEADGLLLVVRLVPVLGRQVLAVAHLPEDVPEAHQRLLLLADQDLGYLAPDLLVEPPELPEARADALEHAERHPLDQVHQPGEHATPRVHVRLGEVVERPQVLRLVAAPAQRLHAVGPEAVPPDDLLREPVPERLELHDGARATGRPPQPPVRVVAGDGPDGRLQGADRLLREGRGDGGAPPSVLPRVVRVEHAVVVEDQVPHLVARVLRPAPRRVDSVVEPDVVHVHAVRRDAHDRAVLLVQRFRMEEHLPALDGVVVELVEVCQGGELWAGDLRQG